MNFISYCGSGGLATKSCLTLATPWTVARQAPLSMRLPRQEYWSGLSLPSPGDLPNPGIEPRSPTLQANSFPAELQGEPKNTGVGTQSLLQGIFLTQELNRGLLHCRRIFYQLSYLGSPRTVLLLLLSRFSRVRLCATPETAAHQAPPSLGFSR